MPLLCSWSRFISSVAVLALVTGCSSVPNRPIAATPSPSVSASPVSQSTPIQKAQTPPISEPEAPIKAQIEASRTVEKCVIRMARVNDPDSPLNVRSSPNATSKDNIVGQLKNGSYVEIKAEQNNWFRIEGETPGWIAKSRTNSNCGEKIERVQFGQGQDSMQIRDRFIGVGTHSYRFNLAKGQKLTVTSGSVFPMIIAPSGKMLVQSPEQSSPWTGKLAETGDYTLQFESNYKGYEYTFAVQVR